MKQWFIVGALLVASMETTYAWFTGCEVATYPVNINKAAQGFFVTSDKMEKEYLYHEGVETNDLPPNYEVQIRTASGEQLAGKPIMSVISAYKSIDSGDKKVKDDHASGFFIVVYDSDTGTFLKPTDKQQQQKFVNLTFNKDNHPVFVHFSFPPN